MRKEEEGRRALRPKSPEELPDLLRVQELQGVVVLEDQEDDELPRSGSLETRTSLGRGDESPRPLRAGAGSSSSSISFGGGVMSASPARDHLNIWSSSSSSPTSSSPPAVKELQSIAQESSSADEGSTTIQQEEEASTRGPASAPAGAGPPPPLPVDADHLWSSSSMSPASVKELQSIAQESSSADEGHQPATTMKKVQQGQASTSGRPPASAPGAPSPLPAAPAGASPPPAAELPSSGERSPPRGSAPALRFDLE